MTTSAALVARLRAAGCVFAEDEARILEESARSADELAEMADARVAGLPLEHVVGWAEFCGLRIAVEPGVFVPRRRTEFLVRQAAALLAGAPERGAATGLGMSPFGTAPSEPGPAGTTASADRAPVVLDLCCGSGAVAAALAATVGRLDLYAADIEPAAVRSARRNLPPDRVFEGDLYQPVPDRLRGRVDLLVANAPYVPTGAIPLMPPEARLYEPAVALDGGADGLDVQRRVAAGAPDWLAPGGHLLIETSERQAPVTAAVMAEAGLTPQVTGSADLDATVVIGQWPGRRGRS